MAFITTGLNNGGQTTHYQIQYDDQLDSTVGQAVGNALVAAAETDFTLMTGWFNGQASPFTSTRMTVNIKSGNTSGGGTGASWNNRGGPITLIPGLAAHDAGASTDQWLPRYLLVSEVVEMFMEAQNLGWSGSNWNSSGTEGSAGEGLSRFLGAQFMLLNGQPLPGGYDIAWTWLQSAARADFVNHVDPIKNGFVPECGCAVLFIYYLFDQLGFTIPEICGAGAQQLGDVYRNLTGDTADPFPYFKGLVEASFPGTSTITSGNLDDPFPLGSLTFYGAKNTFGADEVADIVNTAGGTRQTTFFLALDGFSRQTLGATRPSDPTIAFAGVTATRNAVDAQFQSANQRVPQRVLFPHDVHFTSATEAAFPATGETPAAVATSITVSGRTMPAFDEFFFTAGEDPYFTNVRFDPDPTRENAPWLSQDLRVFTATPSLDAFPVTGGPQFSSDSVGGAYAYAQALITHLNTTYGDPAGVDPFDSVLPGQGGAYTGDSSVTPKTWIGPFISFTNYNFAVCRVRLNGPIGATATGVRSFFRLWRTQTADTGFDPNGAYLSHTDGAGLPLWPEAPGDTHSIPFFATSNAPNFNDPGNPEFGSSGVNNQTIAVGHAGGQWAYFVCFLNLYDPSFTVNGQTVQNALVGDHHCLVAEIAYAGAPIRNAGGIQMSPENSDKLAQRNLQVTISGNPGTGATRKIPQTFELRPSAVLAVDPHAVPDELMIDWGTLPPGSTAHVYWPAGDAYEVVALADRLYGVHDLNTSDPHTVSMPTTSGVSYVPIPSGTGDTLPGLLTVDLPSVVVKGQTFDVVVRRLSSRRVNVAPPPVEVGIRSESVPATGSHQAVSKKAVAKKAASRKAASRKAARKHRTGSHEPVEYQAAPQLAVDHKEGRRKGFAERYVVGSFQVRVPVTTEKVMLPAELDRLAIFKARLAAMPVTDPWHPVLVRYLGLLRDRVEDLGGDPEKVPPSYDGFPDGRGCPRPHHEPDDDDKCDDHDHRCRCGSEHEHHHHHRCPCWDDHDCGHAHRSHEGASRHCCCGCRW